MSKKLVVAAVLLLLIIGVSVLAACSSGGGGERIRASWIKPVIAGTTASISATEVKKDRIAHFKVNTPAGDISFMAYELDGRIYTRADICPPCRSESFSLKGNTLVCDSCGTVFDARNGAGISGACVKYPKAEVPYSVNGDRMVMKAEDLVNAYRETLKGKA